jgi:hypothetical protein
LYFSFDDYHQPPSLNKIKKKEKKRHDITKLAAAKNTGLKRLKGIATQPM